MRPLAISLGRRGCPRRGWGTEEGAVGIEKLPNSRLILCVSAIPLHLRARILSKSRSNAWFHGLWGNRVCSE